VEGAGQSVTNQNNAVDLVDMLVPGIDLTLFAGKQLIIFAYIRTPSSRNGFNLSGISTSGTGGWKSGS